MPRRLYSFSPSPGTPRRDPELFLQGNTFNAGTATEIRLPIVGHFTPTLAAGMVRIRTAGGSVTWVKGVIQDQVLNTQTLIFYSNCDGLNAIDMLFHFVSDLNISSMIITINAASGSGSGIADIEIAASSGMF